MERVPRRGERHRGGKSSAAETEIDRTDMERRQVDDVHRQRVARPWRDHDVERPAVRRALRANEGEVVDEGWVAGKV